MSYKKFVSSERVDRALQSGNIRIVKMCIRDSYTDTAQNMVKLMEISETVWDAAITSNFTRKEGRTIWQ